MHKRIRRITAAALVILALAAALVTALLGSVAQTASVAMTTDPNGLPILSGLLKSVGLA